MSVFTACISTRLLRLRCAPGRVGIATALVLAAEAFLSVLRYQVELLGELSTPPFFSSGWVGSLVAFKQVRGLVRSVLPS